MKDRTRPNLKIIGNNSASGGQYSDVRIIGDGVVEGDVECINFKSVGDSKINGSVKADHLKTVGSISVEGSVESDSIAITGDLRSTGDIRMGDLRVKGGITTKGSIKGDDVRLTGRVEVKNNCEGELFRLNGQLTIGGLLSADDIVIVIPSPIHRDRITISRNVPAPVFLALTHPIQTESSQPAPISRIHIQASGKFSPKWT